MREVTKVRTLVGVLAALVFLVLAVGCGLLSDQGRQEAKEKLDAKKQQVQKEQRSGSSGGAPPLSVRVRAVREPPLLLLVPGGAAAGGGEGHPQDDASRNDHD
jgi:hypothetical protein